MDEILDEDSLSKQDFVSREYQDELFEQAISRNLILYLPTGSGKTYIATMLIREFNKECHETIPLQCGGKRSFFLVNTVALVEQQWKQISSHTPLSVGKYSGNMNVDLWTKEDWQAQLNMHQILVMTAQIFVDLLNHYHISLRNVNLIVFDECHRAVANHPMRQVMKAFETTPDSEQPRILGLTATLLNGNVSHQKIASNVTDLEKTFLSKVSTSVNQKMVQMYSTNPLERTVTFDSDNATGYCYTLRDQILHQVTLFVKLLKIDEMISPDPGSKPLGSELLNESSKKTNKRLKNLIDDIKVNMDDLGVYGGTRAILAHVVQIHQMLPNCQKESTRLIFQNIITECTILRKKIEIDIMNRGLTKSQIVQHYSSNKVTKLISILKKLKPGDSAMVFVRRRFTAKILYYLMKKAKEDDRSLSTIKSNFIVGYNIGNPFKDTRESYVQSNNNKKVMELFNQGEINVLFASNVVEEGVDIKKCNYVIMFDQPIDFRSYIQSKGRARDKNSYYLLMINRNEHTKFMNQYEEFQQVERALKNMLYGGKTLLREAPSKAEIEKSLFSHEPGLEPFKPLGDDGPVVTSLSAISLINRYFASLKNDKFTVVTPYWYIKPSKGTQLQFKCFLQLPMDSLVSGTIEGTWQKSKEDAKRSVALEACKALYKSGELHRSSILPVKPNDEVLNVISFTPQVNDSVDFTEQVGDKVVTIGTKNYKRLFTKKWPNCLSECRPQAGQTMYLHILDVEPTYTPPANNNRLQVVHQILSSSNCFGILSSKTLPKIAPFPLYMTTGELEGSVREAVVISLDKTQLAKIVTFHKRIFSQVLGVVKEFMITDIHNLENSYLIAPVTLDKMQECAIDWTAIEAISRPFPTTDKRPKDSERTSLKVTQETHLHRIISPWYRCVPSQKYLVTKVCDEMSEMSQFPTETYSTYEEYYKDKYDVKIMRKNQPLVEVRTLSSRLNCTKPVTLTNVLKNKSKEGNEDYELWLLPELCVLYPLDGLYWLKAQLLPSFLYRISRLCIAEEVRTAIARDTQLGPQSLPQGKNWRKLEEDISLQKKTEDTDMEQALKPLSILSVGSNLPSSKRKRNIWGDEQEPIDIERDMDEASIFDIINYNSFMGMSFLGATSTSTRNEYSGSPKKPVIHHIDPPKLLMLENSISGDGPEQVEVMQALTAAIANDFVNCERLETLGDSFLKFAISLMLFETQPDYLEGHLTHIKGSVVGNKNLFFCGLSKNLGSILQVQGFMPKEEWVPPGFCVERRTQSVITSLKFNPDLMYRVKISEQEKEIGVLTNETISQLNDILFEAEEEKEGFRKSSAFINQQAVTDKNISDAVEALLGVYLKSCGIFGALKVLNWFEVTNRTLATPSMFTSKAPSPAKGKGRPETLLLQPALLEEILGYKFRDRYYMLQAMTHPSYTRNNITLCYQRLEFLGDAILDFLISVHIFEKCQTLSPGDLTDLRSALVNNITLGALSVRHQLYKFLLYSSTALNSVMMKFVNHQENRDHVIDDDVLFLLEERDLNIAEKVEVPKALGDIFEALIGAIYLDSGKDLNVTWRVIYNLMKMEIENFSKNIPKNQVRMLYESNCCPKFFSKVETDGAVMVTVEIFHNGVEKKFHGFGDNKQEAKRAASKHALRYIRRPSQIVT